jgi:hypothetical protein
MSLLVNNVAVWHIGEVERHHGEIAGHRRL